MKCRICRAWHAIDDDCEWPKCDCGDEACDICAPDFDPPDGREPEVVESYKVQGVWVTGYEP